MRIEHKVMVIEYECFYFVNYWIELIDAGNYGDIGGSLQINFKLAMMLIED